MSLIIYAPSIHQGGGKVLLTQLLGSIGKSENCKLLADTRLQLDPILEQICIFSFAPTIFGRISAERFLYFLAKPSDVILCMANLPPMFPCAGKVIVFLQNRYLVERPCFDGMLIKVRLRIILEQLWLRLGLRHSMNLVVQTPSMKAAVKSSLGVSARVLPFFTLSDLKPNIKMDRRASFVYPATADKHKNHINLLKAWELLAESGIKAELHLTVDSNQEVLLAISRLQKGGVFVVNHGWLTPDQLSDLYRSCAALIYPSQFESLGLPLLEAQAYGIPVIASERDYVRDLIVPFETFDPNSPVSIARAVRRFLLLPEQHVTPMSPVDFLREVSI